MGSKDPHVDAATATPSDVSNTRDDRPRERRSKTERSKSVRDKDSKDVHRHKSHRSSKSKTPVDGDSSVASSHRRHRTKEEKEKDRANKEKVSSTSDLVPELTSSRVSFPYPTFSKAHSKEAVHSRDDLEPSSRQNDMLTPEPTDLGSDDRRRSKSTESPKERTKSSRKDDRPPSPPETDLSSEKKRLSKSASLKVRDGVERSRSRASGISRSGSRHEEKSKLSSRSKTSSQATYVRSSTLRPPPNVHITDETASGLSDLKTAGAQSSTTSVPPKRTASTKSSRMPSLEADDSPESVQDSSPKTPTATTQFPPPQVFPREDRNSSSSFSYTKERPTPVATPATDFGPPPPPPPPPLDIQEVPRVDYLLQNGGLHHPVSRHFLSALPRQNGTRPSNPPLTGCETLFAPFANLLNQYQTVLQKQGSIAVATGHKSVARRLLDRLEDVFSRDLPAQGCTCAMCSQTPDEHQGLGWGEVLERVGGRVEMPSWPPFDLSSVVTTALESTAELPPRPDSPVNLDPDIAEEFRDHYLRQTKKVRLSVDKWMNNCTETAAPPPSEVDDETLAFAILTTLEQEERPSFNALISGAKEIQPMPRAPTPMRKSRSDFLVRTGLQLQRLYRLAQAPRDAETAVYLVKNPFHHDLLATMVDISPQEWEILISGRFDGFLWSGADADDGATPTMENPMSRGATPASGFFPPPPTRPPPFPPGSGPRQASGFTPSRSTTPYSGLYSRGTTPASFVSLSSSVTTGQNRQPVSHDEEVEMAALAEVEREIYQGMEALEDAFEKLHDHAEIVRNALRQRNNGLLMSLQHRRASRIDVLPQSSGGSMGYERPAWATGDEDGITSESDWGGDDFDLAPEDSASNISSSRHRRPKRRNERRTPAPIEEGDEEN
ncbi:putative 5-methylcytosine g t mismatch-specific DNA protein [Rosellinia necatrix]|uniref:Putative 5-methylcytosine g t mismatch-specific DNA protein n=1 Tax=Rosellinia necatrix TaxID=77044 RepID=A0A1W2TNG8_ROSNE|nr:putative 5-methylcytosine g t mismatch-specific DNA protein [Rosellinia necatrix]